MRALVRNSPTRCVVCFLCSLAARGETPAAFGRRCIPADCVAPPSNIPDILGRHALSAGRLAVLGATLDLHHGLLRSGPTLCVLGILCVLRVDGSPSGPR